MFNIYQYFNSHDRLLSIPSDTLSKRSPLHSKRPSIIPLSHSALSSSSTHKQHQHHNQFTDPIPPKSRTNTNPNVSLDLPKDISRYKKPNHVLPMPQVTSSRPHGDISPLKQSKTNNLTEQFYEVTSTHTCESNRRKPTAPAAAPSAPTATYRKRFISQAASQTPQPPSPWLDPSSLRLLQSTAQATQLPPNRISFMYSLLHPKNINSKTSASPRTKILTEQERKQRLEYSIKNQPASQTISITQSRETSPTAAAISTIRPTSSNIRKQHLFFSRHSANKSMHNPYYNYDTNNAAKTTPTAVILDPQPKPHITNPTSSSTLTGFNYPETFPQRKLLPIHQVKPRIFVSRLTSIDALARRCSSRVDSYANNQLISFATHNSAEVIPIKDLCNINSDSSRKQNDVQPQSIERLLKPIIRKPSPIPSAIDTTDSTQPATTARKSLMKDSQSSNHRVRFVCHPTQQHRMHSTPAAFND